MKITVTREKRLHGAVMPYILGVDFDVERFMQILDAAKQVSTEDEFNKYQQEVDAMRQIQIKNGEAITIESEKDKLSVFATNGFLNDDPIYPLSISNMLTLSDGDNVLLKSTGGWLKGAKLVLEVV